MGREILNWDRRSVSGCLLKLSVNTWALRLGFRCFLLVFCFVFGSSKISGQQDQAQVQGEENILSALKSYGRLRSRFLQNEKSIVADQTIEVIPTADLTEFREHVFPLLQASCLDCHGPEDTESRIRIDLIDPDLLDGKDTLQWQEIYSVVSNHEMPPEDDEEHQLSEEGRSKIVDWLSGELAKASLFQRSRGNASTVRRLTKYEYDYALQDLLGIQYTKANELPPETESKDGFQNASSLLQMSSMQFDAYREIGLDALRRAIVGEIRPDPIVYRVEMTAEMDRARKDSAEKIFSEADEDFQNQRRRSHLWDLNAKEGFVFSSGSWKPVGESREDSSVGQSNTVLALPRSAELKMNLDRFLPDDGIMRVRILASRTNQDPDAYASLRLWFSAHTSNNANFMNQISDADVPVTASPDNPQWIHFDISLQDIQRNPFRKLETTFPRRDEFLHIRNVANTNGDQNSFQVFLHRIEIIAPYFDQWPPASHTRIFFDSPNRGDEQNYAREVVERFLANAWGRSVNKREVESFVKLFNLYRSDFSRFEDAMLEVLATALSSPDFLYITRREPSEIDSTTKVIDQHSVARRLALFLWASQPDETLVSLANQKTLLRPDVLDREIERMLADPKARRFAEHFVPQWLGLAALDATDHIKDVELLEAMKQEPVEMFHHLLQQNGSVLDLLHADDVFVNEKLSRHYGIKGVYGPQFRSVQLTDQKHRGGVLTCAATLAMNSDGEHSHPLKRGVWLLERVLNDPPPPPPPNVPEVDLTDPRVLQMTLKERLADHRNQAACKSCHSRIDPWGISFEQYDALGAFRTRVSGQPVDATSILFNGHSLDGIDGLKRYLLSERQDQFALAMVHKMTAYGLGRQLGFADFAEIERMTAAWRVQGDGLKDLIRLIIGNDLFLQNH